MIYLDNNATTRVDARVLEAMLPFLTEAYGNPSSPHRLGREAAEALERARGEVAALLGCEEREVFFTSGGTEANNSAIASALLLYPDRRHIVTTAVEHSAVLKPAEILAQRGYEVTRLGVDAQGQLDLDEVRAALRADTAILSVMTANNETGALFPVREVAAIAESAGVLFHTDAVQAVGKVPLVVEGSGVRLLSLSGHKLHGPKGVGALYIHRRCRFRPLLWGGGQERERRAGTENVAGIVGLGRAAALAAEELKREENEGAGAFSNDVRSLSNDVRSPSNDVRMLRDAFEEGLLREIAGARVNAKGTERLPNTTSVTFEGIESEELLLLLDRAGVCCSGGSACASGSIAPSHVLRAMGLSREQARATLRFSLSRMNTREEITEALAILKQSIQKLRA